MLEVFRSFGITTIVRILGRAIAFASQIILARFLSPNTFGLFAIGWAILRLFSIAGHLGLDYGVINFGSKHLQGDDKKIRSIFTVSLGGAVFSGITFGLIQFYSANWIAVHFFAKPELETILKGFAIIFPFATALRVLAATSSISGKMLCGGISEDMLQPTSQMIFFLFFLQFKTGIQAAIISTIISYVISTVLGLICVIRLVPASISFGSIQLDDALPLFKYSLPTIVAVTLGAFNLWGDRLIVGYFGTETQTGIYQSISLVTMFTTIILSGFKTVIAPTISHIFHTGVYHQLKLLAQTTTRWTLYITAPILTTVAINSSNILLLVFGEEYISGSTPLLLLTIGQLFYVTFGLADQFYIMTNQQEKWLYVSLSTFSLTIFLNAFFIPRFGLLGAAFVSCIMMFIIGIAALINLKKLLGFWLIEIYHLKVWLTAFIVGGITYYLNQQWILIPLLALITTSLIIFLLFSLILWILGLKNEDREIIQTSFKKIISIIKKRL